MFDDDDIRHTRGDAPDLIRLVLLFATISIYNNVNEYHFFCNIK